MAWSAEDTFDTYSDGDLNGNNGGTGWAAAWSGSANYDVQGTTTYQGAKAITDAVGSSISRQMSADISNSNSVVYVAMRRASTSSGAHYFILQNTSAAMRVSIVFNNSGNIVGNGTTISAYSANTWYVLRVTLNVAGSTYTVATSTGAYGTASTFSAESATCNMVMTGNLRYVVLDDDTGAAGYWDYISPTSPFVVASTGNFLTVF